MLMTALIKRHHVTVRDTKQGSRLGYLPGDRIRALPIFDLVDVSGT